MKLFVGLGNPGREYEGTRHNMQFLIDAMKLNSDSSTTWDEYFAAFQSKYGPMMQGVVKGIHVSAGNNEVYVYGAIMFFTEQDNIREVLLFPTMKDEK